MHDVNNLLFFLARETEGEDYNEEEINEAMSSQQIPGHEDHSDVEENEVLEEYDLDNYDEDGEGGYAPPHLETSPLLLTSSHF